MEAKKGIPKSHLSEIMGDRKIKIADVLRCTNIGRNTCARVYQEKDGRSLFLYKVGEQFVSINAPNEKLIEKIVV